MKYCRNCGAQLADSDVFCPNCGTSTDGLINPNANANTNQPPVQQPKKDELSALAIVGFVFAFLASLVGLIISIIAYKQAVEDGSERSKNFAKVGIILSAVFMALGFLLGIILGVAMADDIVKNYPYYN